MSTDQPKPDSMRYPILIEEIANGTIKIPKFQRDFVWSMDKTATLLDSILKGYPIGTFILWQTPERLNDIKNIGNLPLPKTKDGSIVKYVLDGQQRITSLYAAYCCAKIQRAGEKRTFDYGDIYVDLTKDITDDEEQIITSEEPEGNFVSLYDVLNLHIRENGHDRYKELADIYSEDEMSKIRDYNNTFQIYDFSIVLLNKNDINSAIEVFTRINTGGQTLTLFEIMSAKTYDETKKFDMSEKWSKFTKSLTSRKYEGISNSIILNLLSLIISKTKECKRKTILSLDKKKIISVWGDAISSLEESIDYFRGSYGIAVSQLLPYDALLVPFAYFFYKNGDRPDAQQKKYLEEFFWRISLSYRYSSAAESKLAQDIRRIDQIINGERPKYREINVDLNGIDDLIETNFRAGESYCNAVLCLLAQQAPEDFQDNTKVILDNSNLKKANGKNFHHFFPKKFLEEEGYDEINSLMNITLISSHQNNRTIKTRAPSDYIGQFSEENDKIENALQSHFISLEGFGIEDDDYETFLNERAKRIYTEIVKRLNPK